MVNPILHTLAKGGVLKTRSRVVSGRNRIFYKATPKGKKRLVQLSDQWNRVSVGISYIWESKK